jgi:hypothetical protein
MKIGVCSFVIGDKYKNIVKYGIQTRVNYCKKYGYTYIDDDTIYDTSREIEWSKILVISKYLSSYDFLVWIDADTFIMNDEIRLEELIDRLLENKDLMYVAAHEWVNNGIFFVRNTTLMHEYFKETYKNTSHICREQGAMDYLWRINWNGCREKMVIVQNQKEFNSFWNNYSWGDFIIHFPGCNEPNRPEDCLERMMNMFCPIKMDEDTDETYNQRIEWLQTRAYSDLSRVKGQSYVPLLVQEKPTDILGDIMNLINGVK